MKKNIIYKILLVVCVWFSSLFASAQQVNTMYFMDNVPVRHYLNPAFQPLSNFYLGFPVVGYTQFGMGNNSLTLKDVVYKKGSETILFLHPNGDKDKFFNALMPTTLVGGNLQLNILDFGFRSGKSYTTFSVMEKIDGQIAIPRDVMKLLLYGTPDSVNVNKYNLKSLAADVTAYTEIALGTSKQINDQWGFGLRFKFLYGVANISTSNKNLDLTASIEDWTLKGNGTLNYSGAALLTGDSLQNLKLVKPESLTNWAKPAGMGAGIDLGITFKPAKCLTLSAALVDFGFIHWMQNAKNINYGIDYTFTGMGKITGNTNHDFDVLVDSIGKALEESQTTTITAKPYNTYTTAKLNVGAELGFLDDAISLGLLSRTMKQRQEYYEELTASLNIRPVNWFNLSTSYSIMNGRMSNIGAGLGVRLGFIHCFFSTDYAPLYYAKLPVGGFDAPIPSNTKGLSFAVGTSIVFGNRRDADKDGVVDRKDKCPKTPLGVIVDKKGCPVDNDGDGVPDYKDKCPNTPKEAIGKVDSLGCPLDGDNDGVPDYKDKCLDTPKEAIGKVDSVGCSLDTDKDGVFDYLDKCVGTPQGVIVDSVGCPVDTDKDGVADYLDKCPDTPKEAFGKIDNVGCPLDSDGDGVPDYLDLCPGTPLEARATVDKNGCPVDTDGDGVTDYLDKCPDTPKEAIGKVDSVGCPLDTDGDGVTDYLDNCPKVIGVASNYGCPEIKKEVKTLFQKALQGIQFETGKSVIKPASFSILNQIAAVLTDNPTYLIEIQGHTDNVGQPAANLILSDKRAAAVREYLIQKGVSENRMTSKGFGDSKPVATNKTVAGKAKNRRVEFVVSFEETTNQ